jgi:hypothetical protein
MFSFYEKKINGEKLPVTRFRHWPTVFQSLSPDSDYCCQIMTMEARIQCKWPDSGWQLPESSQFRRIPVIEYQNSGTFGGRIGLLTNSNALL